MHAFIFRFTQNVISITPNRTKIFKSAILEIEKHILYISICNASLLRIYFKLFASAPSAVISVISLLCPEGVKWELGLAGFCPGKMGFKPLRRGIKCQKSKMGMGFEQ